MDILGFWKEKKIIDHIQQWKMQEIWNPFHRQNHIISKGFSNFSSNVNQVCIPKSSHSMRETDFVFPGYFDALWGLYWYSLSTILIVTYDLGSVPVFSTTSEVSEREGTDPRGIERERGGSIPSLSISLCPFVRFEAVSRIFRGCCH